MLYSLSLILYHERMKITSTQNQILKKAHKLSTLKKTRHELGLTILDGIHLLEEYLKFNAAPQTIIVSEKFSQSLGYKKLKKELNAETEGLEVPDDLLAKIAPTKTPSGILSIIKTPPPYPISHAPTKILLLDHLQDPGNVGTIIRSAVAAGFEAIYTLQTCEIWSPKTLRASQGAHFYPIHLEEIQDLNNLPKTNWYALSCDPKADHIFKTTLASPLGFIVGNEGGGVSEEIQKLSPHPIHIPMAYQFESLNAAISASICMFQVCPKD